MSFSFGEIVEPTTRALIEDDCEDYPEYKQPTPEYEGNYIIPDNINTLYFVDTSPLNDIFGTSILQNMKPRCRITNAGVEIYNIYGDKYVVMLNQVKDFSVGEIVQLLHEWILKAKRIFAVTSESLGKYQSMDMKNQQCTVIRMLTNTVGSFNFKILEPPNLVTGLGANVLSYCIHLGLKCSLFIVYFDTSPLGYIDADPFVELTRTVELPLNKERIHLRKVPSSNLYL